MDRTVNQRNKKLRDARLRVGWQEMRIWVPTREDADEILRLAAGLRAKAIGLSGLEKLKGIKMDDEIFTKTMEAIANQGSSAYTTESGAVLTLLTELAERGNLADMSSAFIIFARAYPLNAEFVAKAIPAKVLNSYMCRRVGINAGDFVRWTQSNSDWTDRITNNLHDPVEFQNSIYQIIRDVNPPSALILTLEMVTGITLPPQGVKVLRDILANEPSWGTASTVLDAMNNAPATEQQHLIDLISGLKKLIKDNPQALRNIGLL